MLKIRIAPHCSLQPRAALLFFGSMCLVSFTIAGAMAWRGLWPILPFAGLDMLLLGWALRASLRRRQHSQTITVTDRQVALETRNGAQCEQFVFPRHWARVTLHRADTPWHPSRLSLESHGRSYEVGGFLTEEERRALAARLLRSVGRMNESPPLRDASSVYRPE